MKKQLVIVSVVLIAVLVLSSCAAGPNAAVNTAGEEGKIAGFWMGFWHGIIAPFVLVVSLFNDNVGIYEVHNNGGWYNFGYLFGLTIIFGGGGGGAGRKSKQ